MKNVLLKLTECPLSTFQTFTGINQKIGLFILTDEYETQYNSSQPGSRPFTLYLCLKTVGSLSPRLEGVGDVNACGKIIRTGSC